MEQVRGAYTKDRARFYYEKFGLKCCTLEQYQLWFSQAERANTPCRKLNQFCHDCLSEFRADKEAQGLCIASERAAIKTVL